MTDHSATRGVAVVDTNVVVSGLIGRSAGTPPQRLLDAMLDGRLRFVVSVDLLAEYRSVLLRPRVVARHALDEAGIDEILESLTLAAVEASTAVQQVQIPPGVDEQDAHVARLVLGVPGAVLVTGDVVLRGALQDLCDVATPAEAVDGLGL